MKLTKDQQRAIQHVYRRTDPSDQKESYLSFRRRVRPAYDCVMVFWAGMWLGIETDGYTHS